MRRVSDIRKAASAIAGRDGRDGLEVLVLERSPSSRFLPGYVAFPGGSTDGDDTALAERWFGTATEARRACAVRELVEEVGLALTAEGLGPGRELDAVHAAPPRAEQLREIAHWIAPPEVPVRFDARFFALVGNGSAEPHPDGVETSGAWWIAPRALLEEWSAGARRLYWPTYFTMSALATCERVDDLLALHINTREPGDDEMERLPRSVFWQE